MEHARQAGDRWFAASIRARAASALGLGPTPRNQALRWLEDAEAQSATYQPGLKLSLATIQAELGHFGEARRLLAETVAQMNERGMHLSAALAMHAAWDCEMLAGEHAAAEQAIRHGCEQLERLGEHSYLSTYACELAEALYALGRYEESEQWALRGLELGSKDDLATQLFGLSVRSRLLARKGELAAALALAERVDALAASSEDPRDSGDAALYRAELMHLTGARAKAEAMTQRAIDCYQRNGATARAARARRMARQWAGSAQRPW
jgi:tetratricopeptide (TPR) repeat protein